MSEDPQKVAARQRRRYDSLESKGLKKRSFTYPIKDEQVVKDLIAKLMSAYKGNKMKITFLEAKRVTPHSVEATYIIGNVEVVVQWNNIHPGTGEVVDYDLQSTVKSSDPDLSERIESAIRLGEHADNPDLEAYLFLRDRFDSNDAADAADAASLQ